MIPSPLSIKDMMYSANSHRANVQPSHNYQQARAKMQHRENHPNNSYEDAPLPVIPSPLSIKDIMYSANSHRANVQPSHNYQQTRAKMQHHENHPNNNYGDAPLPVIASPLSIEDMMSSAASQRANFQPPQRHQRVPVKIQHHENYPANSNEEAPLPVIASPISSDDFPPNQISFTPNPSNEDLKQFRMDAIEAHNDYRVKHQVKPLAYSEELSIYAQYHAE